MVWTKMDERVYCCVQRVQGEKRVHEVAFRLDGREGPYRVDMKTLSFAPWEAIDGGTGVASVAKGKAMVAAYVRACAAEKTLSPRFKPRSSARPVPTTSDWRIPMKDNVIPFPRPPPEEPDVSMEETLRRIRENHEPDGDAVRKDTEDGNVHEAEER